jgi:hypothetical protein
MEMTPEPVEPLRGYFAVLDAVGATAELLADGAAQQVHEALRSAADLPVVAPLVQAVDSVAEVAIHATGQAVSAACSGLSWMTRRGLNLAVGDLSVTQGALSRLAADVGSLASAVRAASGLGTPQE